MKLVFVILLLLVQGPVMNFPTKDVAIIRVPAWVADDVRVCVEARASVQCVTVHDLRAFLKNRKIL